MEERPIDPKIDRIWYLYVVDETEGPFTVAEIKDKVRGFEAKNSSYIWREGMEDWTIMSTVSEFDSSTKLTQSNKGIQKTDPPRIKSVQVNPAVIKKGKGIYKFMEDRKNRTFLWASLIFILIALVVYQGVASGVLDPLLEKMNLKEKMQAMNLPSLLPSSKNADSVVTARTEGISDKLAGMIRGSSFLMEKVVPKLPQKMRIWLSPVEVPVDVPSTDVVALREAAAEPIDRGPRIAVSLPLKYITNPQFVITTNLPNATQLHLVLSGKKGTLLNSMGLESHSSAIVQSHLAVSTPFQMNNKTFPVGEYNLLVYEADQQPSEVQSVLASIPHKNPPSLIPQGKVAFSVDSFFIGGARDQSYQTLLNQFNEKLRIQVPAETLELKQLHATIESMANESAIKFFKLSNRKISKRDKQEWTTYSNNYKKLSAQIQNQYFSTLPQTGTDKFANRIFPNLYKKAEITFQLSETLHMKECSYFEKKMTMPEIKQLATQTLTALTELKRQISESAGVQ